MAIKPPALLIELIPVLRGLKSPVVLIMRMPDTGLGWLGVFVMGRPKENVNATTPGDPVAPVFVHVTRTIPPPAVGGESSNPGPKIGGPAAIGSVCPLDEARGVEPRGV